MTMHATPLEVQGHSRLSTPEEITAFLAQLAADIRGASLWQLGRSAGGRALTALRVPARSGQSASLRVLLVGSQHGASEAAGGEALLMLARDFATGESGAGLEHLEFVIYPDANPDGRARDSSRNAEEVNINRDFVLLTQPETRALDRLLREFEPHVVLDAHESAVLKQKTLALEGYMTDFETQFDCANNPAIPRALRQYTEGVMLPQLIERVAAHGIPAQRYVREILSLSQVLTHGGLTARKFRIRAGLSGALAFLLETRVDPKHGHYDSYRNIAVRAAKQLLAQREFILLLAEQRPVILALLARHARSTEPLALAPVYAATGPERRLGIALRAIADGELRAIEFPDHRRVVSGPRVDLATQYWITAQQPAFAQLLDTHGFYYQTLSAPLERPLIVQNMPVVGATWPLVRREQRSIPAGSLRVPVSGPRGRLLALLLEPCSTSSVFHYGAFAQLLSAGNECFIWRDHEQAIAT